MSRYVLRLTSIRKFEGWRPIDPNAPALYLHKSVSRDRRHGYLICKVTETILSARSWATREGAEGYLANKFDGLGYAVEEVAA